MGTPLFPRHTYLSDIKFDTYEFFLLLSTTRFTENDKFIAEEVDKAGKKLYFVRTKIDLSLIDQKRDYPDDYNEETSLNLIRKDCSEKLGDLTSHLKVFLISNRHVGSWDFPLLLESLVSDFPTLKHDSIVLALTVRSRGILKMKKPILEQRITSIAMVSAVVNIIPFLGATVDALILVNEIEFYKEQYGIDMKTVTRKGLSASDMKKYMPRMYGNSDLEEQIRAEVGGLLRIIPFVGQVMAYNAATEVLGRYLEWCEADAESLNKHLIRQTV